MKSRLPFLFVLFVLLFCLFSACSASSQKGTNTPPSQKSTLSPSVTPSLPPNSLPKLEVSPNTGFSLDCSHPFTIPFQLYNAGQQDALWVTRATYLHGNTAPVQGITITPSSGKLVAGGHLNVVLRGKPAMSFILSFIYKESPSHAIGISQAIVCQ